MKSWKIGAISGLIAGIVAGIVNASIIIPLIFKLELPYWWNILPPETSFMKIAITEIAIHIYWGIIVGIIYSWIQDLIPGKGISKGLLFGLGYYFITSIRGVIFAIPYGNLPGAITNLLSISPIIFGLVLGLLYKAPKGKLVTRKQEIMSGIIPGAITGLILGMAVEIMLVLSAYFGTTFGFMETFPDYLTDIGFIIGQWGSHMFINMILWGFLGAFYAMFYDRIPGKGIIKGAILGFVYYLIVSLGPGLFCLIYGSLSYALFCGLAMPDLHIFAGILLEGFYKKRPRAFLVAAVIFVYGVVRYILLPIR